MDFENSIVLEKAESKDSSPYKIQFSLSRYSNKKFPCLHGTGVIVQYSKGSLTAYGLMATSLDGGFSQLRKCGFKDAFVLDVELADQNEKLETTESNRRIPEPKPEETVIVVPSTTPKKKKTTYRSQSTRSYIRGRRGGCYYINSNGNKTYVDRSLCN